MCPGESKSVAEALYGGSKGGKGLRAWLKYRGTGSLAKLADPALMLATRGLQYLQKGKGEAGKAKDVGPSAATKPDKLSAAVKSLQQKGTSQPSKPSAVKPLQMDTDLPQISKPDAKTGPKTPSLRHQRAFMRRQARKRRLGIATDFDTSRGSGAFRPGVQGRVERIWPVGLGWSW